MGGGKNPPSFSCVCIAHCTSRRRSTAWLHAQVQNAEAALEGMMRMPLCSIGHRSFDEDGETSWGRQASLDVYGILTQPSHDEPHRQ